MPAENNQPRREGPPPPKCESQTHVHEILGSVKLAEEGDDRHNHRFATVSSEMIPLPGCNHKHAFFVNTDFFDHHHEVAGDTGPAIDVGNGKRCQIHVSVIIKPTSNGVGL